MKRYVVMRSFAGTAYGSYGQGDELDELPAGVDWVRAGLVEDREAESAMLVVGKPKRVGGRGLKPVTQITGIGKKTAGLLQEIGIEKIVDLAVADADELAALPGISKQVARSFIKDAREALS